MKIVFETESLEEAASILAVLGAPKASATVVKKEAASKASTKATQETQEQAEKDPPPKEADKPKAADKPAPAATRDDVAKAIVALNKKKGRVVAVSVLEKFRPEGMPKTVKDDLTGEEKPNEVKLPMVPAAKYGELLAAATEALNAE